MADLSSQINLITTKLSEQLNTLEQEYQRWSDYKTDYDALENQLKTLPDNTTQSAMIPMGKLAFMPGKLIHTNEILVLLGDQYYAERSAKQAVEILGRRRQVVDENLRLVEAQLNSFRAKKESILDAGALSTSDPQMNEEGLPIMEIREELPPIDEKEEALKKQKLLGEKKKAPQPPSNQLPESVLRARKMMAEADDEKKKMDNDGENKALFDLLRELEEEEEEEEEEEGDTSTKQMVPAVTEKNKKLTPPVDEDSDALTDDFSDDEEDEDDDRYDTEISDNMFDRFGDDEQYPLDGVVDQEDFTCYDELPPQVPPAATLREITEDEDIQEYEKSTPKVITKKKAKETTVAAPAAEEPSMPPKKMSKFKLAQQEKKSNVAAVKKSSPLAQAPITESAAPVAAVVVASEPSSTEAPKKKFSKFKLLRQEQKERPSKSTTPTVPTPVSNTPVKESVPISTVAETTPTPAPTTIITATPEGDDDDDEELMRAESKKIGQGIPQVASANSHKPRKMSRFKLQRAQSKQEVVEPTTTAPLVAERIKPKRSVTWDANTDVRDHDYASAPSVVSETLSYSQPMKTDAKKPTVLKQKIRSPADIFSAIKHTQGDMVDDYPSLDDGDNAGNGNQVDLNELIQVARDRSEAFYRPNDGSEALIPMVKQFDQEDQEDEEDEEKPNGIIVARRNKLDNKIMKGAVMERDIAPVDMEQVEDDMDLREITSTYQQKRQSMLAATGGFSFATKPEFEVVEEELPLPRKNRQPEEEEEQEVAPKKMSRFKAARLGMKMDTTEDGY